MLSERIDKSMNGKGKREVDDGVTHTRGWKNNEDGERIEKWRTESIRGSTTHSEWTFSKNIVMTIESYLLNEIVVER